MAALKCEPSMVSVLLEGGGKIDARDQNNRTALHLAASNGSDELVNILLSHVPTRGIQNFVFWQDAEGEKVLHKAARSGNTELVKRLITSVASVDDKCNRGYSTLFGNYRRRQY